MTIQTRRFLCTLLFFALSPLAYAGDEEPWTRTPDVIYGRKYGIALTMDVFAPKANANQAAVVYVMSGGWFSAHEMINVELFREFLNRGYTVFAVVHGSQPKFTIPEIVDDMHRSIRFIRHHAKDYAIDPERIGITGGSAGGHLSLMIATAGRPGNPQAPDPVDRESSRVAAVGCFFPPTDFLNYGQEGRDLFQALDAELTPFKAPFDFQEYDAKTKQLRLVTDQQRRLEIACEISPVTHVTPDDPPALLIHGDADNLVPFQQAKAIQKKMYENRVPFKLILKPGVGHGWHNWISDLAIIANWFDQYLGQSQPPSQ